jgi:hypothetical protein
MADKFNPPSNTFCALPWIHLSTRPDGSARVCCTANASSVGPTNDKEHGGQVGVLKNAEGKPANFNTATLQEMWNNDYMKNVRTQMLNGEVPPSCVKCFKEEAAGHRSKRQWETEYWAQRIDLDERIAETGEDGSVDQKLYYIDLRMGTKCQLKCVMCSPHDSSAWVPDWQKLYPQIENEALKETMVWDNKGKNFGASYNWHKNNQEFWRQLYDQIPHMKQLYFAGGESTIIEEHYELLEKCVEMGYAPNIELRYNSNGLEMPDRLFELWDQFQRVRFHFSIDSIHEMNDYIRYPSKFSDIEAQLDRLDQTGDNIEVTVACAVQSLNIYYLPDFIKWKLSKNYRKINPWPLGAGLINYHFVYMPAHLCVKSLPNWFKQKVQDKYEEFYPWLEENWQLCTGIGNSVDYAKWREANYGIKRLQGMIQFMWSEDWGQRHPEFQEYIQLMDNIRGQDFSKVFPEMADLKNDK